MDQSAVQGNADQIDVQHGCDMTTSAGTDLASSCVDAVGMSVTNFVILAVVIIAVGVGGYFLWRRMRDRWE